MHYLDLSIEEIHLAIKEGKVTPKELVDLIKSFHYVICI